MNFRIRQGNQEASSKAMENQAALRQVQDVVEDLEDKVNVAFNKAGTELGVISDKADVIHTSVISLRGLAHQILGFMQTFPREIRDRLQAIVQADWRTYQAVLRMQEQIARSPTALQESNIHFTNALGEYRSLPYEIFCQWEVRAATLSLLCFAPNNHLGQPFEGFIRGQFKNKPGESKIIRGSFHIFDDNRGLIVRKEDWNRSISPGAVLAMSIVMVYIHSKPGHCPRPECSGVVTTSSCNPKILK